MPDKIKLTFLGTSGAVPTAKRNHSSTLLTYAGENILVDCGEGTQRQFRKARLNPCKVTKILITHWHGDHVLGIPGLLQTLALNDYSKTLEIYGPKGTKNFVSKMLETFVFVKKFPLKVFEVENQGIFFENQDFYLSSEKMTHGVPCNAYCFVKKGELRINKEKLNKSGLPEGPLLQNLKEGKDLIYEGKKFKSKDLTFKDKDLKVCFVLDTSENKNIVPFVKNSDVLVCEATFEEDKKDLADEYHHLTATQAAEIAKKAKVRKLVLTHISQRYEKKLEDVLKEANKVFKNSFLVNDLYVVEI